MERWSLEMGDGVRERVGSMPVVVGGGKVGWAARTVECWCERRPIRGWCLSLNLPRDAAGLRFQMTEEQIRTAEPLAAARFLDEGRNVDAGHVRKALAHSLKRIADLEERIKQLEKRVYAQDATDELG